MRCEECRSTGFTEEELAAHLLASGHDAGLSSTSGDEFPPVVSERKYTPAEEAEFRAFLKWRSAQKTLPEGPSEAANASSAPQGTPTPATGKPASGTAPPKA